MKNLVVVLVSIALLAVAGLIVTSESAQVDSRIGQDQFVSSLLK